MIIVTNIEFLLLGMPDEMTPPATAEINKKFLIIAAIIILVLGIAAWFIFTPKANPPVTESPGSGSSLPVSPSGEQIQWQAYTNQKYGYSLEYPQGWFIDSTNADKDFVNNIGGELILSNKENPLSILQSDNPPSDLMTMTLSAYQVSSQTTPDQFIKSQNYLTPLSQTPITIAGLAGKQMLYILPRDNDEVLNLLTVLKQNARMFVFSYDSFKPDKLKLPDTVFTIHDPMLRSFQLNQAK
jgi:hypothetical protein